MGKRWMRGKVGRKVYERSNKEWKKRERIETKPSATRNL